MLTEVTRKREDSAPKVDRGSVAFKLVVKLVVKLVGNEAKKSEGGARR